MLPEWISKIRKGDILETPSRQQRIVRNVKHYQHNYGAHKGAIRTAVCFTIKHCSWTGRCYTVLSGTDLVQRGFRPTGKRKRLQSKIDKLIDLELDRRGKPELGCCGVKGIA